MRVLRCLMLSAVALSACGGSTPERVNAAPQLAPVASAAPSQAGAALATAPPPATTHENAPKPAPPPGVLTAKAIPIPGSVVPLSFDYLLADRTMGRVYLPLGNTGSLDVFDVATGAFSRVNGFKVVEREYLGKKRKTGPNAAAIGDGVVYVGNRAASEVCAVNARTLKLGNCLKLPTGSDGIVYVAATKEIWLTTPQTQTVTILDASRPDAPAVSAVIKLPGDPEGFALDDGRGLFFTNLEDTGSTLAIDVKSHQVVATWNAACGTDGPRGIAVDPGRNFVFVACTDHLQVLDAGHNGAMLGRLDTGAGVDNIDYVVESSTLVVSAGKAGTVILARFDAKGQPTVVATGASAVGARNAVADRNGKSYVPDPNAGTLLILGQ